MQAHVSFSGGLDSTATMLQAIEVNGVGNVHAVSIAYGQRHARELACASAIASALGVRHDVLPLFDLLRGSSLLGVGDVPHGHYAEASMSQTVVLGRNLAFVTAIVAHCCEPGDEVWIGVHAGDHFVYPDCRPAFVFPLASLLRDAYEIGLVAPFVYVGKQHIAEVAMQRPDIAALTWSCYEGGDVHCGRCGTCVERAEAFHLAGVTDPTIYADPDFWRATVEAHDAATA